MGETKPCVNEKPYNHCFAFLSEEKNFNISCHSVLVLSLVKLI